MKLCYDQNLATRLAAAIKTISEGEVPPRAIQALQCNILKESTWGYLIDSRDHNESVIAFRGVPIISGEVPHPWDFAQESMDSQHAGVLIYRGFLHLYLGLKDQVFDAVAKAPKEKPLYFAGHSMGGALAIQAALDHPDRCSAVYTFGCPRVGNINFLSLCQSSNLVCFRVVNVYDIVPKVPQPVEPDAIDGKEWDYTHFGEVEKYAFQAGSLLGNHSIAGYLQALQGNMRRLQAGVKRENLPKLLKVTV